PRFVPALRRLRVRRLARRFSAGDIARRVLATASTDDPKATRAFSSACRKRNIPVNVVDVPELCSFIVPSILRRGPVLVAVSTGGQRPSVAQELRRGLEAVLPASLGRTALRIGAARRRILRALPRSAART